MQGSTDLLTLLLRYLRQPSTWQGLTLGVGALAAYLGVSVETVGGAIALVMAFILIVRDERKPTEVIKDALAKALEDTVDKP